MTSGVFLEFDARNHAVVNLLGLQTILVLRMARHTCICWGCKSKVPKLFFQTVQCKKWSCEVVGIPTSFAKGVQVCGEEDLALTWLTWHFMTSGVFLEFDASNDAVVNLLGLRATLVLPMSRARCHYCSSKPCWLFSQLEPRSLEQRQPPKNYMQLWDS